MSLRSFDPRLPLALVLLVTAALPACDDATGPGESAGYLWTGTYETDTKYGDAPAAGSTPRCW